MNLDPKFIGSFMQVFSVDSERPNRYSEKICSQRDSHQCINSRNIKCRPKVAQITKKNAESPWKNFEAPRCHFIIKTVETSSQTDAVKTFEKHWQYCETLRQIS